MLSFEYPLWGCLFFLPFCLLVYFYAGGVFRRQPHLRYSAVGLYASELSFRERMAWLRPHLLVWLNVTGLSLLVATSMNPIESNELQSTKQYGVDIAIALDGSGSMRQQDFTPKNRFEAAKMVLNDFVDRRRHDRLGLVLFAGDAFVQAPQTTEYTSILDILKTLRLGMIGDGTAIGQALAVAASRLLDSTAETRLIILITDGVEESKGKIRPLAATAAIQELGIKVYTIGIGSQGRSRVDFELLKTIAKQTGARAYFARSTAELEVNMNEIDRLEKSFVSQRDYRQVNELSLPFLLAAAAILFLAIMIDKVLWRVAI